MTTLTDVPARRLNCALRMVELGFAVFPLRPGSKLPFKLGGVLTSSRDPAQIEKWFRTHPNMNYACDTTDGVVIDIDCADGKPGYANWAKIVAEHGPFEPTLEVTTPSGGRHLYFVNWLAGQRDLAEGINVRGYHGYVVGPGSVVAGREYEITQDVPIPTFPPAGLIPLLPEYGTIRQGDAVPLCDLDLPGNIQRGQDWLANHETTFDGARNNTGYRIACQLKDFGLSEPIITELMGEYWDCQPPLSVKAIEKLATQAFLTGAKAPGSDAPQSDFAGLPSMLELTGEAPDVPSKRSRFMQMPRPTPETLKRTPWLIEGVLLPGQLTAIVAPGGVGKSMLSLDLALASILGTGEHIGLTNWVRGGGDVLLISTEDDLKQKQKRLQAIIEINGLDVELFDRFHTLTNDDAGFKFVVRNDKKILVADPRALRDLKTYIVDHEIKLFTVDPFVEMHDAEENDNSEMGTVMDAIRGVARETDAAGLLIHHTAKAGGRMMAGDMETSRGASAITNAIRVGFTMTRLTDDEADELGLSEKERALITRLDRAKSNYGGSWSTVYLQATPHAMTCSDDEDPFFKNKPPEKLYPFQPFDKAARAEKKDFALFACISSLVRESDDSEISMADAVTVCLIDPFFKHMGKAALLNYIKAALQEPICGPDGYTVQAFDISDGKRPRWVIQGWDA
jgi:RecA-family ATPase